MTPVIKLLAPLLVLTLTTTINADTTTVNAPSTSEHPPLTQPITAQNPQQARRLIEELQFNMQALQTALSQQPQNMTLIKTRTSWIRKLLASLHSWSLNQTPTEDTEALLNKFCWITGDMEDEVTRDDMLDNIELQLLLIQYTQLENVLSQIERSDN